MILDIQIHRTKSVPLKIRQDYGTSQKKKDNHEKIGCIIRHICRNAILFKYGVS